MTVTKRWDCPVASEVRMPYSRRISPWISRSLLAFCRGNQFSRPAQDALSQLTLHQFCTTRILSTHDSSAQHPVTTHITPVLHNAHPVNSWQFCTTPSHNSHHTSSAQRTSCQLMTVLHNTQSQLTSQHFCTVIIMDSFVGYFSKLEHLAHYKGKNKTLSKQTSTSTPHTHTHPLTSQQLWQIIQQCAHSWVFTAFISWFCLSGINYFHFTGTWPIYSQILLQWAGNSHARKGGRDVSDSQHPCQLQKRCTHATHSNTYAQLLTSSYCGQNKTESTFGVALVIHHLLRDGHCANDVITTTEKKEKKSESDTLMSGYKSLGKCSMQCRLKINSPEQHLTKERTWAHTPTHTRTHILNYRNVHTCTNTHANTHTHTHTHKTSACMRVGGGGGGGGCNDQVHHQTHRKGVKLGTVLCKIHDITWNSTGNTQSGLLHIGLLKWLKHCRHACCIPAFYLQAKAPHSMDYYIPSCSQTWFSPFLWLNMWWAKTHNICNYFMANTYIITVFYFYRQISYLVNMYT